MGITVDIGFNPGAISRELGRNRGLRGYRFLPAHRFAVQRGLARKGVVRVMTPCLIGTGGNIIVRQSVEP